MGLYYLNLTYFLIWKIKGYRIFFQWKIFFKEVLFAKLGKVYDFKGKKKFKKDEKTCFFFQGQILIPPDLSPLPLETSLIVLLSFVRSPRIWMSSLIRVSPNQTRNDEVAEVWLFSRFILSYLDIYPFITAFNHIQPKIIKALCLKVLSETTAGKT